MGQTKEGPRRILVLRYRFLGDTILTVPFLRNLRRAEPDAFIAWVVSPGSAEVVQGIPYVDELIPYDPATVHAESRGAHRGWRAKLRFVRELRARRFDKAYVLKRSLSSAILAFLSGARERIGFDTEGRGFLLTRPVPYRHDRHEVENFLAVLEADGVPIADDHLEAWLTEEERRFADRFLEEAGVAPGETVVGIHPFAANPPRGWHLDDYSELARRLGRDAGARILFFGGPKDREAAGALSSAVPGAVTGAVGGATLRQTLALLSRCRLLVCNDSGVMHLAAALGVPLVALFGPQSPVKFGPWGKDAHVILHEFPCAPCRQKFFRECEPSLRGKPACIEAITVDEVEAKCLEMLGGAEAAR